MTQGKPTSKTVEEGRFVWRQMRKKDTLHLLVLLLRHEASRRGDSDTVALIDDTLLRLGEGDRVKMELVARMREIGESQ